MITYLALWAYNYLKQQFEKYKKIMLILSHIVTRYASEVSRIFKKFQRFGKKFELNLLNVRIFCKCDKYSKDSPMRIFRMSESFANVKIISKIHQS